MGEKVEGSWGINADYTARCGAEAGESLLGLVTESVKRCVNTRGGSLCVHDFFIFYFSSLLDVFKLIIPANM